MAGPLTTAGEWLGKKILEPAVEFGAKLVGRGGRASVEKGLEKLEPVLDDVAKAKPKLSPEETKAFLKAQEEAKAAKLAAEKAKPLDFTPSENPSMVIQKSGEKAGSASAKTAEAKAAEAKAAEEGSAGLKGAAISSKPLSFLEARRIANLEKMDLSEKLTRLLASKEGSGPKFVDRVIASARASGLKQGEWANIEKANLPPEIVARIKKFYDVETKLAPARGMEAVAAKIEKLTTNVVGFAKDPLKTIGAKGMDIGLGAMTKPLSLAHRMFNPWAEGKGIINAWKTAGLVAVGGWAAYNYGGDVVGGLVGSASKDSKTENSQKDGTTPGSENPYKDTLGAKAARGTKIIAGVLSKDATAAVDAFRASIDSEAAFTTFRGAASEILMSSFHTQDYGKALAALKDKMAEGVDGYGFSPEHIALVDKFMDPKTKPSDFTKDQKEQLADLIEYHMPNSDKKGLEGKFKRNKVLLTAATGGTAAALGAAGANLGGGAVAAAAGAGQGALEELEDLKLLGTLTGIDTSDAKNMGKNTAKAMADFAKKNPVAAGLGAYFGFQTQGHGVVGAAKKGIMGLIFAGIINWVMNAMGIKSSDVMNMGKGLFNNVLGPVTGAHMQHGAPVEPENSRPAARNQYEKGYFPGISEAKGMNNNHAPLGRNNIRPASASATDPSYNLGDGQGTETKTPAVAASMAKPEPVTLEYGFKPSGQQPSGVVTSPVAQPSVEVRSLAAADEAIAKAQQSSKAEGVQTSVQDGVFHGIYGDKEQVLAQNQPKQKVLSPTSLVYG